MFFEQIYQLISTGTDLSINIRRMNDKLNVAVMPRNNALKEEQQQHMVPLVLSGTPEELDREFLQAVMAPVKKALGILTNLEAFEKAAEKTASQAKPGKTVEKESKEAREKREKMEKLMKKADDAAAASRFSEAQTWLKQARLLATADKQKEIDAKMQEIQRKANAGSLFGAQEVGLEPPAQQPVPTPAPAQQRPPSPIRSMAIPYKGLMPDRCHLTERAEMPLFHRHRSHSRQHNPYLRSRNTDGERRTDSSRRQRRHKVLSLTDSHTRLTGSLYIPRIREPIRMCRHSRLPPYRHRRTLRQQAEPRIFNPTHRSRQPLTVLTRKMKRTVNCSVKTLMPNTRTSRKRTA